MNLRYDIEKRVISFLIKRFGDAVSKTSIYEIRSLLEVDFDRADLAEEMIDSMVCNGVLEPNLPPRSMIMVGAKPNESYRILPAICEWEDANGLPDTPSEESDGQDNNQADLQPRYKKAFQSYNLAAKKLPNGESDRDAHSWLKENGPGEYELPDFETWRRYLRKARAFYKAQKNSPTAGRSGKSVANPDEI